MVYKIGKIALDKLDLVVNCVAQRLIANPVHPDQLVSKVQ